jgi:hypothetical protein
MDRPGFGGGTDRAGGTGAPDAGGGVDVRFCGFGGGPGGRGADEGRCGGDDGRGAADGVAPPSGRGTRGGRGICLPFPDSSSIRPFARESAL